MKIKLKVLTPLHIGSGKEIAPIEYICYDSKEKRISPELKGDKFMRIDMDGLFQDEEFKPLMDKFIESCKTEKYIGELLPGELLFSHILYQLDIPPSIDYSLIVVREFIKSAGRVYIPGSSLKGAILSGVIYKIAKERKIKNAKELQSLVGSIIGEVSFSPQRSKFSRWLDVSDSNFKSPQESLELSFVRVKGTRGNRGIPVVYETLKKNTIFEMEIKTSIDSVYKFGRLSEEEILKAVNEFYEKVYEKERKSRCRQALPARSDKGFLIRLGQGSTCLSTSFLLLAEVLNIKDYKINRPPIKGRTFLPINPGGEPSTRKLVLPDTPLGWAELYCG